MTHRRPETTSPNREAAHEGRSYSSFTVRIWHSRGATTFERAEVHHIQSGNVIAGTGVDSEWIRAAMDRHLNDESTGRPT